MMERIDNDWLFLNPWQDDEDAFEGVRLLAKKEGLLVGISSGANVYGALELAKKYPNKKIVTIAPDGIEKYISMGII